jgi:ketosteroid isomerase-like protein
LEVLSPSDIVAIEQLEQRWLACEVAGRAAEVLDLCSPEIVWFPPGEPPIRGKDAIGRWLEASCDRVEDIQVTRVALGGHASWACKVATFRTRYVPNGSTEAAILTGWHVWILRPCAESRWCVTMVVWSLAA